MRNIFALYASFMLITFCFLDASYCLFFFDKFIATDSYLRKSFGGKRIWITGASSGIGKEFTRQFYKHGANVILSSRKMKSLENVQSELGLSKERTQLVPFDMTASNLVDVVRNVLKEGSVDIVVLNAALFQEMPATETSMSVTRELMRTNFDGPVELTSELIKLDKWDEKRSGHVVVMSSRFGKLPGPLSSSYAATKFALQGYFTSFRAENSWLRTSIACPGPVATSLYKNSESTKGKESFYESMPKIMQSAERVAQLIISGMSGPPYYFTEMWISKPGALIGFYQAHYFPVFANRVQASFGRLAMRCYEHGNDYCMNIKNFFK